jgi:hypothetical protein
MPDETPRYQEAGDAEPILPEERAADDWRRDAQRDPTATTGDELGAGVDEDPDPMQTPATNGAQLPPTVEDVDREEQIEID